MEALCPVVWVVKIFRAAKESTCNGMTKPAVHLQMKTLFSCCALLLVLLGCKKDSELRQNFAGSWEYEKFVGFPGIDSAAPGNGRILILTSGGTYTRKMQGNIVATGKYSIRRKKDCSPRNTTSFFTSKDLELTELYIRIEDEKLVMSTSNCVMDGGTVIYRRLP